MHVCFCIGTRHRTKDLYDSFEYISSSMASRQRINPVQQANLTQASNVPKQPRRLKTPWAV